MEKLFFCPILIVLLVSSCATHVPFYIGNPYGAPVRYCEGRHPGIDFNIMIGTPIIASSDGMIQDIATPYSNQQYGGGISVEILHRDNSKPILRTHYAHLSKVFVKVGQSVKRGELIGLSGASNDGYAHLHFGVCKTGLYPHGIVGGSCCNYSATYDPMKFWLADKAQCFDPTMNYSSYSQKELTLPIACGKYKKELVTRTKKED